MIVNLAYPKTKKTYTVKTEDPVYMHKKLNDEVDLSQLGVTGKGIITGGSSKEGFPMAPFLDLAGNKKALVSNGFGFKSRFKGEKKRRTFHGRIIDERITQVNIKVLTLDKSEDLEAKFGKKEEPKEEKK